jgi:hypothetical protein
MDRRTRLRVVALLVTMALFIWGPIAAGAGHTINEVFLSNHIAQSEVTYVIQFESGVRDLLDQISISLPSGSNAAHAAVGRLVIADKVFNGDDLLLTGDSFNADTLIVILLGRDQRRVVNVGTRVTVELFNLRNPSAGNYSIAVRTIGPGGRILEVIPPIAFSTLPAVAQITGVTAGTGLIGGGSSGDVILNVNTDQIQTRVAGTCPPGSAIQQIDATGNVTCQTDTNSGGDVTGVTVGTGLAGGGSSGDVTLNVDTSQIQTRVTGTCPPGSAIQQIDATGNVICQTDTNSGGDVSGVTAGTGLTGGGGSGDVILSVNTSQIQARVTGTCPSGSAIQQIDATGNVTCQTDTNSGGDVTGVTVGTGLTGGGSSGDVTLNVDTGQIQTRVTGTCPSGSAIQQIDATGNVTCQTDTNSGGDVSGVTAGTGLTGGGGSGDVILSVNTSEIQTRVTGTCSSGSAIQQIDATGNVTCQTDTNSGGTVTSVVTGAGLTGGPITSTGTITIAPDGVTSTHIADGTIEAADVNATQIQLRVTGSCAPGSLIRAINGDGTVVCDVGGGGVAAVTASFPVVSSGGTTPNISLSSVIIQSTNTALGERALLSNTGTENTASGAGALLSNTTGEGNTASGAGALLSNTTGSDNTATGAQALVENTTGSSNTASGAFALVFNTAGHNNTASGSSALQENTTGAFNTASGSSALQENTTGAFNTASGGFVLTRNTTGSRNTATGFSALQSNITGDRNTAIGFGADVSAGDLTNATAIGAGAIVDASHKIRLGNSEILVIEAPVGLTVVSDKTRKENFQPVDGEDVLGKIGGLTITSWNYIGHDPKAFRHYGPVAQDFFAAFGHDGIGTIGTPTTITSTDMAGILMIAIQALEKRTAELRHEQELLKEAFAAFKAENIELRTRMERLERTTNNYAMHE